MKAKSTVPGKGKRLEFFDVEPSKQPATQLNEEDVDIDLREFRELFAVTNILEKLYRADRPSLIDCEDESRNAYKKGSALLTYADFADVGLHADHSELPEPVAGELMDAIQLQLDIMRLASMRLYSMCKARDEALAEGSAAA
jgi:hypothetical protein